MNTKQVLFLLLVFTLSIQLSGQKTHLQFGVFQSQNQLSSITPSGKHYGYLAGIDSKLFGVGAYLLSGLHYLNMGSTPSHSKEFFKNKPFLTILKTRGGIGLTPLALTRFLQFRLKGLFSYNHMLSGANSLAAADLRNNYWGLDFGAGITVGIFCLDLEFEKGYHGLSQNLEESKFDIIYLTVGIIF